MINSPSRFYWSQGRKGRTPICWRSLEIWSECAARLDSGPGVALADVPMRRGADYERRQRYSSPTSKRACGESRRTNFRRSCGERKGAQASAGTRRSVA